MGYSGLPYSRKNPKYKLTRVWASMRHRCNNPNGKKGYYKNNCRWVDKYVQANNRSNNRKITFNGITKNLNAWADLTGLKRNTITQRLDYYGWSISRSLSTPARKRGY